MKKKIAIYTSTRADFGLLRPLIAQLIKNTELEVRLFVTGTHLKSEYGYTITEIEKDYKELIYYKVPHIENQDKSLKNLDVMGDVLKSYATALIANKPDLAVVLGDRYEALSFGLVCANLMIPLVHIHGGEITTGAIDDKFRHSLTKLSEWHMVACEEYRQRVICMGESPERVYNCGALGVDNALHIKTLSLEQVESELKVKISNELYLFTYHPETNSSDYGLNLLRSFLKKLKQRVQESNAFVILTGVNSDAGRDLILSEIQAFVGELGPQALFVESLGVLRYLSVLKLATAVIGNSSSGVLESYSMGTPAVNIGSRQDGRIRESNVIDLKNINSIEAFKFTDLVKLKSQMRTGQNPSVFGNGKTAEIMAKNISQICTDLDITRNKAFYDAL